MGVIKSGLIFMWLVHVSPELQALGCYTSTYNIHQLTCLYPLTKLLTT